MILNALKYTRYAGEPREWHIIGTGNTYAYFDNINLLVGKNASGKSRTLNVIREIANLLSGKIDLKNAVSPSENFEVLFTEKDIRYRYILEFKDRKVSNEILSMNDKTLLDRNKNILVNANGQNTLFEVEDHRLVICAQDAERKPYFREFIKWGLSLRNYLFANQFEKNKQVKDYTRIDGGDPGIEGTEVLIYTFYRGRETYGESFVKDIMTGMRDLGYSVTGIDILEKNGLYGICVEEEGEYMVTQHDMSQGMFRSLALLIMLSYARLSDFSLCMLIDDMGEGLDFDTSRKMMDIVIRRIDNSNLQFFMTTNDRYVMNQIPLKYWTVIDRAESSRSVYYNHINAKDNFEDFKYTGLNNFDFLTTDFYKNGFGSIDEEDND